MHNNEENPADHKETPSTDAEERVEENFIDKLKSEVAEYKDKYFRQLAETENMRKRLIKERQEMVRFGIDNIIAELLQPVDNLENALKSSKTSSAEVKNWAIGFEMILGQFKEMLSTHNVSSFVSVGEKFDPFLHEAVEIEETLDKAEGTILQEFIKGYRSGDRIIRPARVKVAKPPSKKEESSPQKEENNS